MYDRTKDVMACWRVVLLVREGREPYFPYQTLCLGAQMSYEIEYRQIIEGVKVKQILRVHDGETLVIDEAASPEDVETEVLVGVRSALAIPRFADYSRIAISVEDKSAIGRWKNISEDFAANLRWDPQKWWIGVQGRDSFRN
jgi:hypothetical protein